MKTLRSILFCLALVAAPFVFGGATCAPTQQRVTYNTLATVGQTVDAGVKAYLDLEVKGQLPTNSLPRVTAAYNDFQTAYRAALAVAQFNTNTVASQLVQEKASAVLSEINTAKGR